MKSIQSTEIPQSKTLYNTIYEEAKIDGASISYYYFRSELVTDTTPVEKYSLIHESSNSDPMVFYHTKSLICGKIPGIMHCNSKLEYVRNSILNAYITDLQSKTFKFQVLYSKDIEYVKIYGFIPKNNIHVLSIQINGITVFYTDIVGNSSKYTFEDQYMDKCSVYIEDELSVYKYSTIYIESRIPAFIEELGIDENTKFIQVEIQYHATGKSTASKLDEIKDLINSQKNTCLDDMMYSMGKANWIQSCCFASDMDKEMLAATKFAPEKDCHIYNLIQDRKKKGLHICYDCTVNCKYKNLENKKDV